MQWGTLSGVVDRYGANQGSHLLLAASAEMAERQGHHHRHREADPGGHLRLAANGVALEPEAIVEAAVDALHRAPAIVSAPPGRAAVRSRGEDAAAVLLQVDADHPTERARLAAGAFVAIVPSLACEATGGGRATVLESRAVGLEPLERHRALGSGGRALADHLPSLGMVNAVVAIPEERTRNRLGRVVARLLLFGAPQRPAVDQRADPVLVPERGFQRAAVEAAVGAELLAALRQGRVSSKSRSESRSSSLTSDTEARVTLAATGISYCVSAIVWTR